MAKRIETKVSNKIIDDELGDVIVPRPIPRRRQTSYPDFFQRLGLLVLASIVWYFAWALMPQLGIAEDNGRIFSSFLVGVIVFIVGWVRITRK